MTEAVTTVRRATPDDARAIFEVRVATWRAYRGLIPRYVLDALDADLGEEWFEQQAVVADGHATFVAEQEGRVVGFVSVGQARGLEHTGEIDAIYALEEAWESGAGEALVDEAAEWLLVRWDEAVLWVAEENLRARRFYERCGWIAEESRVAEVAPGAFVPEVRYRLSFLDRR